MARRKMLKPREDKVERKTDRCKLKEEMSGLETLLKYSDSRFKKLHTNFKMDLTSPDQLRSRKCAQS
jgi:hypothetical protein